MKRIYISGPMAGYDNSNIETFRKAATVWEQNGWEPLVPHDGNDIVWMRHFGRKRNFYDPTDTCEYGDVVTKEILAQDFISLFSADAVALLPGWQKSKGANAELVAALLVRLPIYDAFTMELMHPNVKVVVGD